MKLRPYQVRLAKEGNEILKCKGLVYYALAVRVGKSLIALETCKLFGAKKVLFITKIKAFSSIQWDYDNFGYEFNLSIINKESIHKIEGNDFDIIVCDEAHGLFSSYPKPNAFTKAFKKRFADVPLIYLSGTPSPESHSQWFNQFWVSNRSPFKEYANFYKWAVDFVNVKQKKLGYATVNDYSDADEKHIMRRIKYHMLTFTQEEAGFTSTVNEMVLEVPMKEITYAIIAKLKKDLIVTNKDKQVILADTGVKLMQKIHQLSSGTCKFEDGSSKIIDYSKAEYIRDNMMEYKLGIFYKFKEEYNALKEILGDKLTDDLDEFNSTDKSIALQVISGREGLSLKNARYLVYYNIDFSATTYWQSRDRLTTMDRKENDVFWLFSKGGIEYKIYKAVMSKKNFTLNLFRKEFC